MPMESNVGRFVSFVAFLQVTARREDKKTGEGEKEKAASAQPQYHPGEEEEEEKKTGLSC